MSEIDNKRIFEVDFNFAMICPSCNEKISTVYEVLNKRRGTLVSVYTVAYVYPKCKAIVSISKARF